MENDQPSQFVLPEEVIHGLTFFNAQDYFAAHEALETAWRAESRPIRELYHAILQIAVAYYHIQRGNLTGARKVIARGLGRLALFPDWVSGIHVRRLLDDAIKVQATLERQSVNGIASLGNFRLQVIEFDPNHADDVTPSK